MGIDKVLLSCVLFSRQRLRNSVRNLEWLGHGISVIRRSPHPASCPPNVRLPIIALPTMAAPENLSTLNVSAVYVMVRYPLLCF